MDIDDTNLNEEVLKHIEKSPIYKPTVNPKKCMYLFEDLLFECTYPLPVVANYNKCARMLYNTFDCDKYEDLSRHRYKSRRGLQDDFSVFPDKETLRRGIRSAAQDKYYPKN